jgi:hypothetical protein
MMAEVKEDERPVIMSSHFTYDEVDLVDYFARTIDVLDKYVVRVAEVPKCLAAIDSFVTTPMRLAKVLFLLGDELDRLQIPPLGGSPPMRGRRRRYPLSYISVIKQVARRIDLDAGDPRSFRISAEAKQEFRAFYEFAPMSELDFQVWLNSDAPFEIYDRDAEEIWETLRRRDTAEYLWYWQVSHADILRELLFDRRFLAGLEASYARRSGADPSDIFGMLDQIAAHRIRGLSITLRFTLYGSLARRVAVGLVRIPHGLKSEFPEYYADENSA